MKPLFFHPCFLFCDMRIIQIITFFRGIALSLFIPLFIFFCTGSKKKIHRLVIIQSVISELKQWIFLFVQIGILAQVDQASYLLMKLLLIHPVSILVLLLLWNVISFVLSILRLDNPISIIDIYKRRRNSIWRIIFS